MGLTDLLTDRIERATALDRPAGAARDLVQRAVPSRWWRDLLHGLWLGHPLHPTLAQLALGSLVSASLIDATGGSRRESSRLITVGLLAASPTAAAGWVDYSDGHEEQQRVGLVHAATNIAALSCYAGALLCRRSGQKGGRLLSVAGGVLGGLGAALGGHLSFRQASGANHAAEVPHVGPADWRRVGVLAELPVGTPVRRMIGDVPAFVLRHDPNDPIDGAPAVTVLSDRCPHLSGPLHEGQLSLLNGQLCITCPWHASVFKVGDGTVVHGPATAAVPRFETQVDNGVLHARVVTLPGVEAS
ncbi:MAG: Rieske (2Fe-2S) protein [Pseudonocardia sp.]|nr:Rieske (2Fe-2S) protein [Pseudonocardia sp.]